MTCHHFVFFVCLFSFPFSDDSVRPGFCVHDVVTLVVYAGGFAGMVSVLSNVFSCATLLSNKGKTTANLNHHPLFVCLFVIYLCETTGKVPFQD